MASRRPAAIRALLIGVSVAGVFATAGLWLAGRYGLGLRVLAGGVLAIVLLLLQAAFLQTPRG